MSYLGDRRYEMTVDGQTYNVFGELSQTPDVNVLKGVCNVNGVEKDITMVTHKETLHLFSLVCTILCLSDFRKSSLTFI